ncbi:fungal-specific transcription factor domain-containing protein [Exophiala viscosa]|uniref:Fungal-specific transcription factor domain-containing protein n=1 Tax=Exophiala viscosa TaxID=2486360 RepID=A0AAN6DMN7_9EURO|nr:fungal-specific transcription factor domain-containing protein [Exophiala viscosa]
MSEPSEERALRATPDSTSGKRASIACVRCRNRRTKCYVSHGETKCRKCLASGTICEFRVFSDDKRFRSNVYMQQLEQRLDSLQDLVGTIQTTKTQENLQPAKEPRALAANHSETALVTPSPSGEDILTDDILRRPDLNPTSSSQGASAWFSPVHLAKPTSGSELRKRLLSKRGHLLADHGKLCYFGPTTSLHVHAMSEVSSHTSHGLEQSAMRAIRQLSAGTHTYLMDIFWSRYNAVFGLVSEKAFIRAYKLCNNNFYSVFLHVTMLGMAARYADKSRPDIAALMSSQYESVFHAMARGLWEPSLSNDGLPTIQGLMILSDLEAGPGRTRTGWMLCGIACRSFFELGLNIDVRGFGLTDEEIEVRQTVASACMIIDKCWAMYLCRPIAVKTSDLHLSTLRRPPDENVREKSLEKQYHDALLDLYEIAGKIADRNARLRGEKDHSTYRGMTYLAGELTQWYNALPHDLSLHHPGGEGIPEILYVLHLQYHTTAILCHLPLLEHDDSNGTSLANSRSSYTGPNASLEDLELSLEHAHRVGDILELCCARFTQQPSTFVHNASVAASAFITTLDMLESRKHRDAALQKLLILSTILQDLAHNYTDAHRMYEVVASVLSEQEFQEEFRGLKSVFGHGGDSGTTSQPAHANPSPKRRKTAPDSGLYVPSQDAYKVSQRNPKMKSAGLPSSQLLTAINSLRCETSVGNNRNGIINAYGDVSNRGFNADMQIGDTSQQSPSTWEMPSLQAQSLGNVPSEWDSLLEPDIFSSIPANFFT